MKILNKSILCLLCFSFVCLFSCSKYSYYPYKDWYVDKIALEYLWNLDDLHNTSKIKIAIIDSGFDNQYLDFLNDNIVTKYNAFDDSDDILDYYGHGTIITELIGGKHDNSSKFYGINPNCELILIKALNNQGLSSSFYLAKAVDFAVENHADIINLSLGSTNDYFDFRVAVEKAIENDIFVVSAVGDSEETEFFYPSLYENVLSIGNQTNDGSLDKKSNKSLNKELIPIPGDKIMYPIFTDNKLVYKTSSGSSFSCAIFSGILSLILSKFNNVVYDDILNFFTTKITIKTDLLI